MSDIAEKLLAAIAAAPKWVARTGRKVRAEGYRSVLCPRDEKLYQDTLRRCAADREEVEDCQAILADSARHHPETLSFVDRTLARLARGYGLEDV